MGMDKATVLPKAAASNRAKTVRKGPVVTRFYEFLEQYFTWVRSEPSGATDGDTKKTNGSEETAKKPADVLDFTFGNPQHSASDDYINALITAADPPNRPPQYFAYRLNEPHIRDEMLLPRILKRYKGLGGDDHGEAVLKERGVLLTTGAFAGLAICVNALVNPGDEVLYLDPAWFFYEALVELCGGTTKAVMVDTNSNDDSAKQNDMENLLAAISPRTKVIIFNNPHNPTGRVYDETWVRTFCDRLRERSIERGEPIYLVSDEAYCDFVFDGREHFSPLACYEYTIMVYTYGKVLLAPSQRIGYLAVSERMPGVEEMLEALELMQVSLTFCTPNAILQENYERFEQMRDALDVKEHARRRDVAVDMLRELGYVVRMIPQGTFYLMVECPLKDDMAFAKLCHEQGLLLMPGRVLALPGMFRLTLTAREERLLLSKRALGAVMEQVRGMDMSIRNY